MVCHKSLLEGVGDMRRVGGRVKEEKVCSRMCTRVGETVGTIAAVITRGPSAIMFNFVAARFCAKRIVVGRNACTTDKTANKATKSLIMFRSFLDVDPTEETNRNYRVV